MRWRSGTGVKAACPEGRMTADNLAERPGPSLTLSTVGS